MYTREEVKAIVDKVVNMAKADAVEVNGSGSERAATRWANSSITVNMVRYDRSVTATVRVGTKVGSATRQGRARAQGSPTQQRPGQPPRAARPPGLRPRRRRPARHAQLRPRAAG